MYKRQDWTHGLETSTDYMNELGHCVSLGDWMDFAKRDAALAQITPTYLKALAGRIFHDKNMTVTHVIPTKHVLEQIKETPMPSVSTHVSPAPSNLIATSSTRPWSVSADDALHIVTSPLAKSIRVRCSNKIMPSQYDLADLVTKNLGWNRSASDLMAQHAERHFSSDREYIRMDMMLPLNMELHGHALDTMYRQDWLNPTFSAKEINIQKRGMIAELRSKKLDPRYQLKSHFMRALFRHTPYDETMDRRIQRIQSYSKSDLERFHAKYILSLIHI